ncbi:cubilin homolog [Ciona intestinalis]
MMSSCVSSPCLNDGKCFENQDGILCDCSNGYSGKFCEIENFCSDPNFCKNGGSCFVASNSTAMCLCANGFKGNRCEILIDSCEDNPCQNNSTCVDIGGNFTCR